MIKLQTVQELTGRNVNKVQCLLLSTPASLDLEVVRGKEVVDVGAVVVIPAPLLLRDVGPPLPWRGRAVLGACRALLLPGAGRPASGRPVLAVCVASTAALLERETHEELQEQWRNEEDRTTRAVEE
jgi:hypothetical protein